MEFKGTKGNWEAKSTDNHSWVDSGSVLHQIADVYGYSAKDSQANAKLIAAAPELLEACTHALEMCNDLVMPTENDLKIMSGRLKQAINKALS